MRKEADVKYLPLIEEMTDEEADAAGGEPPVASGDQQHVPQPAGQQCGDQYPGDILRREKIEAGQQEQEQRLRKAPLSGEILPAVVQVDPGAQDV